MQEKGNSEPSVVSPRDNSDQKPLPDNRRSEHEVEHVSEDELQKVMDRINEEDAGLLRRLAQ